jgi:hypothetical protein
VKKKKAPKTKDENGEEDEENLQMKKVSHVVSWPTPLPRVVCRD